MRQILNFLFLSYEHEHLKDERLKNFREISNNQNYIIINILPRINIFKIIIKFYDY